MEGDARAALLRSAIGHLAEHGLGGATLRGIAAAIGTSHRMLIYHFGSRDGLVLAIVRSVEEEQRAALAELAADAGASTAELARRMWERVADPRLHPHERLFFELYGRALQGDPGAAPMLEWVVPTWVDQLTTLLVQRGLPADQARATARLGLATVRGLLLDLLATGDRAAADAAHELFIRRVT
ncbi:TetR/AcrR family transcriptional regulator [Pseudonocardia adelaidensis]|uniref:TetR/AcrR family transcriptional regulator n=1 Tax=Pseudonocardia adelaidensis TaxID=648754 RepID=A0ABP9N6L0_9PSEU